MRRFTATLMVALACGVPLVPLLPAGAPANPACCRRNGAHHCMTMSGAIEGPAVAGPAAPCPYRDALVVHSSASRTLLPLQFAGILSIEYRHSAAAAAHFPDAAVAVPHDRGPPLCSPLSPSRFA